VDLAVPRRGQPAARPDLTAFDREHINGLLAALGELDTLVGAPIAKTRMGGGGVGVEIPPERLVEVARALRDRLGFHLLVCVTGVDMIDHIQSIYHLRNLDRNWLLQVRVKLAAERPEVDSLYALYPAANWLEREQYDMVGIVYRGHPDLRRILLDDEFQGYPLRKGFRPTPLTVHERATTQADGERAISGEQQRRQERIVPKHFGQGNEERIHPGKPTFGSAAVYLETGQGMLPEGEPDTERDDATDRTGATRPRRG